jgi:Cdc6-like AAA superfamily ATPase
MGLTVAHDRVDSLKDKQRDKHVSEKLDTMMAILLESLNVSARSGPMSDEDGNTRSVRQQRSVRHEVTEVSLSESYLFGKISNHIWNKQWKPDSSLLASFPKQTNVTREGLIDFIADTLRFPSMDDREHAISRPFELTYDWVFDLEPPLSDKGVEMWSSLPTWLENKDAVPYWITGKPGSGKSTMMKFITDSAALDRHLQSWSEGRPVYKIRYYAWKPGQELDKSKDGLMRTLMHQMITADPELTPHLFPRRWTLFHMTRNLKRDFSPSCTTWELEESMSRLFDHAEGSSCKIILMIDGLDEFDVAPADICAMIKRIASHACIKVCVASRPWPQFSDTFANSPRLQMHLLTRRDILTFVDGHFRRELAFQQINKVYANGGDRLLAELVEKS